MEASNGEPRIGVFICRCGFNIGGVVDVHAVAEYAKNLPHVVFAEEGLYTCSSAGLDSIKKQIETQTEPRHRRILHACNSRVSLPENVRRSRVEQVSLRDG
jgi:heterodisulfide reductase subunit A